MGLLTPIAGLILEPDNSPTSSTLNDSPAMIDGQTQTIVGNYCDGPDSWGVDLGGVSVVDAVNVYLKAYGTPTAWYPNADIFGVYSSTNGTSWTLQETFVAPSFSISTAPYITVRLALASAIIGVRYIKVRAMNNVIATNPGGANSYICEITVEGEGQQAPKNYLCSRLRDRIRTKGVSLGQRTVNDRNPSYIIDRHNRLRVNGVSKEPAQNGYRYFRIFITDHTNTEPAIAEITMSETPGGVNFCTGGVASASHIYSASYPASNAFDGNNLSYWDGYPSYFPYPTYDGAWIKYDLQTALRRPKQYSIKVLSTAYPKSWIFQVSIDDAAWTDLDTRTDQTFTSGQLRTFDIG